MHPSLINLTKGQRICKPSIKLKIDRLSRARISRRQNCRKHCFQLSQYHLIRGSPKPQAPGPRQSGFINSNPPKKRETFPNRSLETPSAGHRVPQAAKRLLSVARMMSISLSGSTRPTMTACHPWPSVSPLLDPPRHLPRIFLSL